MKRQREGNESLKFNLYNLNAEDYEMERVVNPMSRKRRKLTYSNFAQEIPRSADIKEGLLNEKDLQLMAPENVLQWVAINASNENEEITKNIHFIYSYYIQRYIEKLGNYKTAKINYLSQPDDEDYRSKMKSKFR